MQRTMLTAIILVGVTAAHAQTAAEGQTTSGNSAIGSDPLGVTTSSLPSTSTISATSS